MQTNAKWILKYSLVIVVTVLRMVSVLYNSPTQTELGRIIDTSVHCLYCNPGFYPHGLLWYAIVIPIAYLGNPITDMLTFTAIDMLILILLINNNKLFIPYFIASFYDYFVIPQNIPVLWLTLLGIYNPIYLAFPILAKLPVGAPYPVWSFIFTTSLHITTNYQADYGVLVMFWLYILSYHYRVQIQRGWNRLRHNVSDATK
jgi:hypothetical protein